MWDSSQLYTTGAISVASASIPGDYNQNGTVDAADYILWRKNSGTTNTLPNDPIGGTIGTAQFDQWRAHFGQTAGSGAGSSHNIAAPVPEPFVAELVLALSASLPAAANAEVAHFVVARPAPCHRKKN